MWTGRRPCPVFVLLDEQAIGTESTAIRSSVPSDETKPPLLQCTRLSTHFRFTHIVQPPPPNTHQNKTAAERRFLHNSIGQREREHSSTVKTKDSCHSSRSQNTRTIRLYYEGSHWLDLFSQDGNRKSILKTPVNALSCQITRKEDRGTLIENLLAGSTKLFAMTEFAVKKMQHNHMMWTAIVSTMQKVIFHITNDHNNNPKLVLPAETSWCLNENKNMSHSFSSL